MLDHHIGRTIVYRLAFADRMRFSELQPDAVENKLFSYHLKKVVSSGYVQKNDDGTYSLTPEGRRLGIRVLDSQMSAVDRADSVLFLAIRRQGDKAWLLYRRKTHPLINRVGFMHASPIAAESTAQTATRVCLDKTGIAASFTVLGSGYFRVFEQDKLESFTHFTFLVGDDATGDIVQNDSTAEFYWDADPDFTTSDMLPNMKLLGNAHKTNQLFYIEETLSI
jgi:hypothetical protein